MLKALIIIIVLIIILRWLIKPRVIINMGGMGDRIREEERRKWEKHYKKNADGTLHVDHIPESINKKTVKANKDNGEYIDYEEIK